MKGLIWLTSAVLALTACGKSGGGGSGLGEGDVFPSQYQNTNYSCTGTSTNGKSQGQQYTLVASISAQPTQLNGEARRMQASIYNQSGANQSAGAYNYSNGYGNNSYNSGYNSASGIGQSEPAEARYFQSDNKIVLTPSNTNGTRSNWSGQFQIWAANSRGEFNGRMDGLDITMHNMSCNQSGGTLNSSSQYGQTGGIPQVLNCRDSQYTASINNGTMTLSSNGGTQETYTLVTNGQAFNGQTTQTYSVQSRTGQGGSGTVSVTQSSVGGGSYAPGSTNTQGSPYTNTYGSGGNYRLSLSNVYYQNRPVNSSMTCN